MKHRGIYTGLWVFLFVVEIVVVGALLSGSLATSKQEPPNTFQPCRAYRGAASDPSRQLLEACAELERMLDAHRVFEASLVTKMDESNDAVAYFLLAIVVIQVFLAVMSFKNIPPK